MHAFPTLTLLTALATPIGAQCCLGAQNCAVDSAGGRHRVEATSLTGTGPAAHGPYRFRFRTLRVPAEGEVEVLGTFERAWDNRHHFHMQVHVSPTGNGFLLGSSLEPGLRFFAPDGTVLREIECAAEQHIEWYHEQPPAPNQLQLNSWADGVEARRTWLWLPLCHVVGPELRRGPGELRCATPVEVPSRWPQLDAAESSWLCGALTWSPGQGERERPAVERLRDRLRDAETRADAAAGLLELGLSARPVLQAAAPDDPEVQAAIRSVLSAIRCRLCGHDEPWRHRELLEALLTHPDAKLAHTARARLRALGEQGSK